ncbi:putative oocyte-secreted protein 1 homolog [Talpa occidentalis]|uniref:putative oocyte-secreted protein 1 homolog n=1 Tax=Talpa occidentalis TaxID=50954 RepID=UPI00188F39B3|nr:putative oocyte-secreted protein 1 homolog [Talpa occidentalis]
METSVGFKKLFLLFSMLWTCTGDLSAIQVYCTEWWFFAKIKPTIFNNVYMNPEEAFLGDNCPVTYLMPGLYYEFFYHPYDCGIKHMIFQECLVLKTKIKYISSNSNNQAEMPLLCIIRSQHPFINDFKRRGHDNSSKMELEVTMKMHIASEDTKVASAMQPWENPNDTCVANDVPLITKKFSLTIHMPFRDKL